MRYYTILLDGLVFPAFDGAPLRIYAWTAPEAVSLFKRDPLLSGAKSKPVLRGVVVTAAERSELSAELSA
jgi:hypothetical protein